METLLLITAIVATLSTLIAIYRLNNSLARILPTGMDTVTGGKTVHLMNVAGKWLTVAGGVAASPLVMASIFTPESSANWVTTLGVLGCLALLIAALLIISACIGQCLVRKDIWNKHLAELKITNKRHSRIAAEGALLGTLDACGFSLDLVIISDDAGQFNVLAHALCWIHADRVFQRIVPFNDNHAKELDWARTQIWEIYADLKRYKRNQDPDLKEAIEAHFDELCRTRTSFATLHQALKRLAKNKKELLLVLERPNIPLHNNLSEHDIRAYVIKRKIRGSTRSENGRRCRDTFTSLIKTCRKHGINFWDYLGDRLRKENLVPYLPDVLRGQVCLVPDV